MNLFKTFTLMFGLLLLMMLIGELIGGVQAHPDNSHPATAHLFIVSPLSGKSFLTLFSTHPPIPDRVKRLEAIASGS